ncbi:MAG: Fructose-1,6-bisphosphatase/inositol-1-monophosphatase [Alphaproteobacteria bacterium MarineAlpha9_Bin3]|nr:MAG: Fructose-1,6-bisphosphatase/inositol-1-monophosphatase [Alphaproteobacteria bacterium MarineAlpha9_Bin3]|tara:strand:- start:1360 stop:2151 length:792 start_codon:yes stop_codon:yes gene_type:complete
MSNTDDKYIKFAHELADSIHDEIKSHFRQTSNWEIKPTKNNKRPQIATNADLNAEKIMRRLINKNFPSHGIIGEELGSENENAEYVWVLDPIDGTKAFVSGLPFFGTMIGLIKNSEPILGLIDQPITKDRIWGSPKGSFLNNKSVQTRNFKSIDETICAITDPAMFIENDKDKAIYNMVVDKTLYVRHGTDCWGYAMCAGGTIDLVLEKDLEIWDIVAARAIIEAAGGIVTAWNKTEAASDRSVIAAANIETYRYFTEIIESL